MGEGLRTGGKLGTMISNEAYRKNVCLWTIPHYFKYLKNYLTSASLNESK